LPDRIQFAVVNGDCGCDGISLAICSRIRENWSQRGGAMKDDVILNEMQLAEELKSLPGWEIRDGWLRRTYKTPGWSHTLMLANTIAYTAESAYHHPDLSLGYAAVTVKLQTHRVRGITTSDVALARRIDEVALWKPPVGSPLSGFPKNWVQ
jgi:4a-hydroxytetrahydrobiopterin dehydratase